MIEVQKTKYVLWAADADRAIAFYQNTFGAEVTVQTPYWNEVIIAGSIVGIHPGGEGKRTWTGLSFQVPDVLKAVAELKSNGGLLKREPEPEDGFVHLAMCIDTEGNEFMLTAKRPK